MTSNVSFLISADKGSTIDDFGLDKDVGPYMSSSPAPVNNIPFPKMPSNQEPQVIKLHKLG
jgi:hypothetical protein